RDPLRPGAGEGARAALARGGDRVRGLAQVQGRRDDQPRGEAGAGAVLPAPVAPEGRGAAARVDRREHRGRQGASGRRARGARVVPDRSRGVERREEHVAHAGAALPRLALRRRGEDAARVAEPTALSYAADDATSVWYAAVTSTKRSASWRFCSSLAPGCRSGWKLRASWR